MRPSFHLAQQHVSRFAPALLPIALVIACTLSDIKTPVKHSLFVNSIAWLVVSICYGARVGLQIRSGITRKRKLSWLAGFLYALAQVCERAAADREGLWWAKSLLPLTIYFLLRTTFENDHTSSSVSHNPTVLDRIKTAGFRRCMAIITGTSVIALNCAYVRFSVGTLGVCSVIFTACALLLLEQALGHGEDDGDGHFNTSNGLVHKLPSRAEDRAEEIWTAVRDMAGVIAVVCLIVSLNFESFKRYQWTWMPQLGPVDSKTGELGEVRVLFNRWNALADFLGIVFEATRAILLTITIRHQGALESGLITLGSTLIARIVTQYTWWQLWLTLIYALTVMIVFNDSHTISVFSSSRRRMKAKQLVTILAASSLVLLGYNAITRPRPTSYQPQDFALFPAEQPVESLDPLRQTDRRSHPVDQLIRSAETQFNELLARQSSTLEEATAEYRRRYGIPPPPRFDVWYEFARRKNVQLIDEFDTIHQQLLPFWGIEPSVIRARVTEAIGYDNMLLTVQIRGGQVVKVEGGADWQREATVGMIKDSVEHLPDMDLAFNIHDEPRVIVPADHLAHLVNIAKEKRMPAALATQDLTNSFSSRPADMTDGKRIKEIKITRFNRFAHQHTWSHSRASCPQNSPARDFEETSKDNVTSYAYGDLGFVYNHTAFSDICMSPSFRETFGFFDRPNAFNIVQDLFPIFSQSKISSFQDIIYPSPWYWAGRVGYDEEKDMDWEKKENRLYWRGSTTGGFSRNGGWRRQHRQRVVRKINAPDTAQILRDKGDQKKHDWQRQDVSRKDYEAIMDVNFSHVGQCDPGDCEAQKEFFNVVEKADQQDAWKFKYLLDMDGNAFSGRFYAFLQSKSLVYKMSIFQEWHKDWLKPWVHYIPLSLKGDEWLESVRYFAGEADGKVQAPRLALQGREWAKKALRNEDFEVWFFRLLLEYGRLIDDNRETIGYPGA